MAILHRSTPGQVPAPLQTPATQASRRPARRWLPVFGLALAALLLWVRPAPAGPAEPLSGSIWVGATGPQLREPVRLDQLITDLRAMPFDEVIVQVRANADAFYNSKIVPRALGVSDAADPLATLIKKLHAGPHPRRVIAWLTPFHAGNANTAAPLSPDHVLTAHPDWLSLRQGGGKSDNEGNLYLEPGLPAVQQHLEAVVRELASNYDIDGLYFDPVSDPGPDWGYHPEVLKLWRESGKTSDPAPDDLLWVTFRADVLDVALAGMIGAAREVKPKLTIAIGARTDGPAPASLDAFHQSVVFTQCHQDWPRWLNPPAQINRLYLKDFKPEGSEAEDFNDWLRLALAQAAPAGVPVTAGVAGYLNESVDAHAQLRRAAEAGAQGVALADYQQPTRDTGTRQLFMTALARTVLSPAGRVTLAGGRATPSAPAQIASTQPAPPTASAAAVTSTTAGAVASSGAVAPSGVVAPAGTPAPAVAALAAPAPAPASAEPLLPVVSSNGKFVRRLKPLDPSPLAKAHLHAAATSGTAVASEPTSEPAATLANAAPPEPVHVTAPAEAGLAAPPTKPAFAGPARIGDVPAAPVANTPVIIAENSAPDAATSTPAATIVATAPASLDPLQAAAALAAREVNQTKANGQSKVAAATTTGADALKLPPPPLAIEEVPLEGQEANGAQIEEGQGRLLPNLAKLTPAHPAPAIGPVREGDVPLTTLQALAGLKGDKSPKTGDRALSDTLDSDPFKPAAPVTTRREQITGLLVDPAQGTTRTRLGLLPKDKAQDFLRKNFGNLFEP